MGTVNRERLLALAFHAIEDGEARAVLQDAIEETGWSDGGQVASVLLRTAAGGAEWNQRVNHGRHMGPQSARAIAAVLLFESWPTSWPLAMTCALCPVYPMGHGAVCSCRLRLELALPLAGDPTEVK